MRNSQVMASIEFPVEPFICTVKEFGLTPALCSLLVLRRRSYEELIQPNHPDYSVFMALIEKAGTDRKGNLLFKRAPDGEEVLVEEDVVERVRDGGNISTKTIKRKARKIDDELPVVAAKYTGFVETGEV